MEKSIRGFSIKRIISSDYATGFFTYAFLIAGTMYFIVRTLDLSFIGGSATFEKIAIITTCIAAPVFAWRIYFFKTLYKRGLEIAGTVTFVGYFSKGHRIEYEYIYQNQKYVSGNALAPQFLKEKKYNSGDKVMLLVNPKRPKKAVIKDIYF